MKEYELSRWSKGVTTASPVEDFTQIMLYIHNGSWWYDNRAVILSWLLFVWCLLRCIYLWLHPATVIFPAPSWAPERLLPLDLFWVKWFVSKREALMPERCVYVSHVLGMASAYPDAGISWALVCVRACTPAHAILLPTLTLPTTTSLWWVYQIGISWHPLPPASPTHPVNITFRFILLPGRDTDPRQSTDLLPFYHTYSELHKTNKNNYWAFEQKVSKHETDAWMLSMDSIGCYLQP